MCDSQCQADQRAALQQLFQDTNGQYWLQNSGWNSSADHCAWFGIICCFSGVAATPHGQINCSLDSGIAAVVLPQNALSGVITYSSFKAFAMAHIIDLHENNISGTLPDGMSPAPSLQYCDLASNAFSGTLSTSLFQTPTLQMLKLDTNAFTGSLPAMGNLTDLAYLGGPIPDDFSHLQQLEAFAAAGTGLWHGNGDLARPPTGINEPDLLPSFLHYDRDSFNDVPGKPSMDCPGIKASPKELPSLSSVTISPAYFSFQVLKTLAKLGGPPGNGKALTIVTSDIEGSTELWEKDPEATNMALQLHDDIFRRYLSAYYGFELATEGDAFVLAFHSAPDAVMYCLTVQKAYQGKVPQASKAIGGVAQGGQILMDAASMTQIMHERQAIFEDSCKRTKSFAPRASLRLNQVMAEPVQLPEQHSDVEMAPMPRINALKGTRSSGDLTMVSPIASVMQLLYASRQVEGSSSRLEIAQDSEDQPGRRNKVDIILIHMGLHMIEGLQGIVQLYQIAIPGLEDRARITAPLSTLEKLGAGYFDAPGAGVASLQGPLKQLGLPHVAIVFCGIEQADVMKLPNCSPVLDASCHLLLSGPRVRMGIYNGVPARIQPHITTGRADYFGKLVNRAARFCHAGAHGGQIAAPLDLVQSVISTWCGIECPPLTHPPSTHHLTFQQGPLADCFRPFSDLGHTKGKDFPSMPEVSGRRMSISSRHHPGWTDDGFASRPLSFSTGTALQSQSPTLRGLHSSANSLKRTFTAVPAPSSQDISVGVTHIADMTFKGIPGIQTVMSISTGRMASLVYPPHAPSPKGTIVRPGTGLWYVIN
ncbi:hypothetical protein WJX74_008421 [Apatococcus lobatus]|uniref:Guanylate cyclase domain-containing protein n=1 Tax=Apatococcus lobatus TaxID=904363 RepID=A0AAW1SAB6_9CHLO